MFVGKTYRGEAYDRGGALNLVSTIPVLFCRHLRTSISLGMYSGLPIRTASVKKLHYEVTIMRRAEREPDVLACAVHEVKLATVVIHNLRDRWVVPQPVDRRGELLRKTEAGIDGGEVQLIGCDLLCGHLWCQPSSQEGGYVVGQWKWHTRFWTSTGSIESLCIAKTIACALSNRFW